MKYVYAVALFLVPTVTLAAPFLGPIVPECSNGGICGACDLVKLADNLLRFMVAFSVFVAAIMFAYAGFLYVTAAANKTNLETAKKIFWNVFLGFIFILTAWLIIDLSLRILTGNDLNALTNIQQCPALGGASSGAPTGGTSSTGVTGGTGGVQPGGGLPNATSNRGIQNIDSTTNYDPTNNPNDTNGGGPNDYRGNKIYTAQDYLNCQNTPGCVNKPVTVAVPQRSGIAYGTIIYWPEAAQAYGLPANTPFAANDHYGAIRGYTDRGTYSIDIARCGEWNTSCTLQGRSRNDEQPFTTKPTTIPPGA